MRTKATLLVLVLTAVALLAPLQFAGNVQAVHLKPWDSWWASSPDNAKIDEGKSATYNLHVASNHGKNEFTITNISTGLTISSTSFSIEEGKAKTIQVKITMPARAGNETKKTFSFKINTTKWGSTVYTFTVYYRDIYCTYAAGWVKNPDGTNLNAGSASFKYEIKNTSDYELTFTIRDATSQLSFSSKHFTLAKGGKVQITVNVYKPSNVSKGTVNYQFTLDPSCGDSKTVKFSIKFR